MEPRAREAPPAGVRAEQRGQEDPAETREAKPEQSSGPHVLLAERLAVPDPDVQLPRVRRGSTDLPRLGNRLLSCRPERDDGRPGQSSALRHVDDTGQTGQRRPHTSRIQTELAHGHEGQSRLLYAYLQKGMAFEIFFLLE